MDQRSDDQCRWESIFIFYRLCRCMISCMHCKAVRVVGRWGTWGHGLTDSPDRTSGPNKRHSAVSPAASLSMKYRRAGRDRRTARKLAGV
jgi:hypothetical protein